MPITEFNVLHNFFFHSAVNEVGAIITLGWGKRYSERQTHLPKTTQLIKHRAQIWTQAHGLCNSVSPYYQRLGFLYHFSLVSNKQENYFKNCEGYLVEKKKSPFGHIYGVAIANTATTLHAFPHLLGRGSVLSFGTLHCSTLLSSTVLTYWSFSSNKWLYPQGCWIIYLWIPHTYHGARYVVCIQWMFKWLKKWIQRFRNLKNRSELKEIRWMR